LRLSIADLRFPIKFGSSRGFQSKIGNRKSKILTVFVVVDSCLAIILS